MIIGIDGNEANVERRVGIGEYSFELLRQFEGFQISHLKFQIYLKTDPREDMPHESDKWSYKIVGPKPLWTRFALPKNLYIDRPRPDIFFSPSHYGPQFSPIPTAISIMDMSFIHFPELFASKDLHQLRLWTWLSAKKAKKIFTISQASKNDIIHLYNVREEQIVVTYPGIKKKTVANSPARMELLKEKYGIEHDFILFVGTLQPRKNVERLIEAFHLLLKDNHKNNLSLVIIGKKGWLYEQILQAPKKFHVEEQVKFLDFVSDEDLGVFYQHARCFVLPSLYEGFGLPVLEAMQYGCPVIMSNVSSLPEAGGDAAVYIDPTNADDIAKKMKEVTYNDTLRKEMKEKGYNQIKKFNWEKTAKQTLSVLEELVPV